MRPHSLARLAASVLGIAVAGRARAQSGYLLSAQLSGLGAALKGSGYSNLGPGWGGEAQVRVSYHALSLGGGVQSTRHRFALPGATFPVSLTGGFLEPRYVIVRGAGLSRVVPYVSMRLSTLRQHYTVGDFRGSSSGVTTNVGGGALVVLRPWVNVEAGATYGYTNFHDFSVEDVTTGERTALPAGAGSNLVVRLGTTVGIWR